MKGTDPTHLIDVKAPAWTRPGTRVRLLPPIAEVEPGPLVWAFCLYPDGRVRPVPPEQLAALDG